MIKKKLCMLIVLTATILVASACVQEESGQTDIGVEKGNALLLHFEEKNPGEKVIKCGYEDVTDDGIKDLVVIYNVKAGKNGMKVVVGSEDGKYNITGEVPAPADDQDIQFKNIDEKGEVELIISGSKNGNVGYAIFRIENMEIINIFGEGMEDCC